MQKPEERPWVVSTMRSPSRWRTKHAPRWPSCSLQSRGHRSHWMRPSSIACHQRPGWFTGRLEEGALRSEVRLLPRDHAIALDAAAAEAKVSGQSRLQLELVEELHL